MTQGRSQRPRLGCPRKAIDGIRQRTVQCSGMEVDGDRVSNLQGQAQLGELTFDMA
jgi:hypothetical protein